MNFMPESPVVNDSTWAQVMASRQTAYWSGYQITWVLFPMTLRSLLFVHWAWYNGIKVIISLGELGAYTYHSIVIEASPSGYQTLNRIHMEPTEIYTIP